MALECHLFYCLKSPIKVQKELKTAKSSPHFRAFKSPLTTHALLKEGLEQNLADNDPEDGKLTIREWLLYAVAKVPELDAASTKYGFRSLDQKATQANLARGEKAVTTFDDVTGEKLETKELQIPHLFDYSRNSDFVLSRLGVAN